MSQIREPPLPHTRVDIDDLEAALDAPGTMYATWGRRSDPAQVAFSRDPDTDRYTVSVPAGDLVEDDRGPLRAESEVQ
jgi:hypothetical protein